MTQLIQSSYVAVIHNISRHPLLVSLCRHPSACAALNMFDTLAILLLLPVFDQGIYPYCKRKGMPLSMLAKIGTIVLLVLLLWLQKMWRHGPSPPFSP